VIGKHDIQRLLQSGVEYQRARRFGEAEAIYRRVLGSHPRNTDALYLLGLITQSTRRFAESVELFERATRENPRSAKYFVNLGLSLGGMGLGRTHEAMEALRKAVAIDPSIPAAWSNLGNEFFNDLRFEEAIEAYQRALRLKPDFADAMCNLGGALQEHAPTLGPALEAFERAAALQPDFATAHWNLGFVRLLLGDYARGLPEYEWRLKTAVVQPREFAEPLWDGSDLAGRRILLHTEQGLGDTIQMARYLPRVAQRGGTVILECSGPLVRLMRGVAGVANVVALGEPLPEFDVYCPIMSLPLMFKTTLATIPWDGPYLRADEELAAAWSRRLARDARRPRIGLVWAGRAENKVDWKRSMRLEQFAQLASMTNARFFSLQKGRGVEEARRPPAGMELIDFTEELRDFADTAALVANLDLVISVDTGVAHLAGAMGRPVWILLPYRPDWRWMMDREDSPWYPSVRLFRQEKPRDWATVIDRVKQELLAEKAQ